MKNIQKLIGTILIVMLISVQLMPIINVMAEDAESLTITTYGENEEGIRSDLVTNTANLTVKNVQDGNTLSAYKILDVFYNAETNEMTYDFTSDFQAFLTQSTNEDYQKMTIDDYFELTSDKKYEGCVDCTVLSTASTLNVLVSKYATYIRSKNITGIDMTTDETSSLATAEVAAGSYLILPKSITTTSTPTDEFNLINLTRNLYGVLVGNVVFSISETTGEWELNDLVIYSKSSEGGFLSNIGNYTTEDYFSGNISFEDIIIGSSISSTYAEKLAFAVAAYVPNMPTNAITKIFQVEIDFDAGINYDSQNIYIIGDNDTLYEISDSKILDANDVEIGTLKFEDNKLTAIIDAEVFTSDIEFTSYKSITFLFDVELNKDAVVGVEGNEIITTVTTTDDPYVENSVIPLTTTTTLYTYGLELTSFGEVSDDGTAPLLKGAKYEVYTKYTDSVLSNKVGEIEVGDDGKATLVGLPQGTLYLKQTKAPTGYQLIKDPIAVEIATETAISGTKDGYYQAFTYNNAMWYLPSTGGMGTIIYTIVGLFIIFVSSVVVIKYKKSTIN